ncbi:IPT/TIG domain-containing protein [Microbacterium sp. CFBP 8794]|uniref:IPT/TIG domain-containing protein n=1 Tax=Microbacterium sp. CFBP 8794 TaxID=2775269 RepID=UPI001784B6EA|nr:IPT/TIG domain-containing protein [Microbacterium sp. CFBP 8794]MBD8477567.1 IPT/TIG domain-containing protein [Microbacterium sp. CFBP 8794]
MVDAFGNDISAVGIPVTGSLGIAPGGTTFPTAAEGAAQSLSLDPAFEKAGLLTEDGGFEWMLEPDGDRQKFFQEGYSIPSGLSEPTLVVKLAQYDRLARKIAWGKTPDANGYLTIDAGGYVQDLSVFTEEIFKGGVIVRRVADVFLMKAKMDKSERGKVRGLELTFGLRRSPRLNNEHVGEWLIPPVSTVAPTITSALPTAKGAGETVTITGTNFYGATSVTFGGVESPLFQVTSSTQIKAALPAGSAGSAPIVVTGPAGASTARAYTRA